MRHSFCMNLIRVMKRIKNILGGVTLRRVAALAACAVILYFVAGGAYLHQHKTGDETPCHVCQSLHAPALTASAEGLLSAPRLTTRHWDSQVVAAPSKAFSLDRAGRAPPTA